MGVESGIRRHSEAADVSYHQDFLRFYQTFFFDRNLQDYSENLFLEILPQILPGVFQRPAAHKTFAYHNF
jgi:hypothetical protein